VWRPGRFTGGSAHTTNYEVAQSMLVGCASHGVSIVEIDERHEQEALRSQLRRLARQ
jgi:hypothetical protein